MIACVVGLAGCADEGRSPSAQPGHTPAPPINPTTMSPTPPEPAHLTAVTRTSLPVRGATVEHLTLFGRWVGYAVNHSDAKGSVARQVEAIDVSTKQVRAVATSSWPQGQTDWVEGTGNWIFWTDQQQQGSDQVPSMKWRILGEDLSTGRKVTVAESPFPSPVPIPRAGAGRLAWFEQAKPAVATVTIKAFDTTTATTRVLLDGVQAPSGITAGPTFVTYDLLTSATKSNLWRLPWTGGQPTQVTTDDHSRNARSADDSDTAVWEQATTGDASGLSAGDPSQPAHVVSLGLPGASNAVPGDGFVALLAADGSVQAAPITAQPTPVTLSTTVPGVPCRIAVDKDRVAFCQAPDGHQEQTTIEIVTLKA
jgi:hypothetical protein